MSYTVFGNGFGFWKTMPIRRRTSTADTAGSYRSTPWNRIVPSTRADSMRSFMRLKQRSSVVLPQPDGPMKAVISCLATLEPHVAHGPEVAVVHGQVLDLEHRRDARRPDDGLFSREPARRGAHA